MKKFLLLAVVAAVAPLTGQVKTSTFVADLSPSNQNPPLEEIDASGHAVLTISTVWENDAPTSAIVDFRIMLSTGQGGNNQRVSRTPRPPPVRTVRWW